MTPSRVLSALIALIGLPWVNSYRINNPTPAFLFAAFGWPDLLVIDAALISII